MDWFDRLGVDRLSITFPRTSNESDENVKGGEGSSNTTSGSSTHLSIILPALTKFRSDLKNVQAEKLTSNDLHRRRRCPFGAKYISFIIQFEESIQKRTALKMTELNLSADDAELLVLQQKRIPTSGCMLRLKSSYSSGCMPSGQHFNGQVATLLGFVINVFGSPMVRCKHCDGSNRTSTKTTLESMKWYLTHVPDLKEALVNLGMTFTSDELLHKNMYWQFKAMKYIASPKVMTLSREIAVLTQGPVCDFAEMDYVVNWYDLRVAERDCIKNVRKISWKTHL